MQLFNGDCLELMKTLPDKSVDLFVCDLPYGCLSRSSIGALAEKKGFFSGNSTGCDWDIKLDLNAFWIQVKRLCKDDHTPVLMFCNTKFGYDLIKSNESWFRYDLVWNKMRGVSFLSANKMPMRSHEMVYVFAKKGASYYRKDIEGDFKGWSGNGVSKQYGQTERHESKGGDGKRCALSVISHPTSSTKGGHPTEKPVELYKFLIERYSKKGDCVLDPTFGSGNSGRASAELERKYIGIEKDEKFFEKFKSSLKTNVPNPVASQDQEAPRCV